MRKEPPPPTSNSILLPFFFNQLKIIIIHNLPNVCENTHETQSNGFPVMVVGSRSLYETEAF